MEAEYLRLKMLSKALTQFLENASDNPDETELELAEAELENINVRLESGLI